MTPASAGGEQQACISGGIQSPIWYSLRQDCRDAQKKYVMHCMTRISQQECRGILDFEFVELIIKTALINKVRSLFCIWKVAVDYEKLSIRIIV